MNELIKQAELFKGLTGTVTIIEAFIAFSLSFILSLIIAIVYKKTHDGISYNKNFAITMIIVAVVVSAIMIIIGSNIARAFSLVGALSIIRYRTAVKDPKDVAYVFFAMAVGMACGTMFYMIAIMLTFFVVIMIYFLHKINFGSKINDEFILKINFTENIDYEKVTKSIFSNFLLKTKLIKIDSTKLGTIQTITYSIILKPNKKTKDFINLLKEVNNNQRIQLLSSSEQINL